MKNTIKKKIGSRFIKINPKTLILKILSDLKEKVN